MYVVFYFIFDKIDALIVRLSYELEVVSYCLLPRLFLILLHSYLSGDLLEIAEDCLSPFLSWSPFLSGSLYHRLFFVLQFVLPQRPSRFDFEYALMVSSSFHQSLEVLIFGQSKQLPVELVEDLLVKAVSGICLPSLHNPDRTVDHLHDELSVVFVLPGAEVLFGFAAAAAFSNREILGYVDAVAIDEIILIVVGSVDFVDHILHLEGTSCYGRLGVVWSLVVEYLLHQAFDFDNQIDLQLLKFGWSLVLFWEAAQLIQLFRSDDCFYYFCVEGLNVEHDIGGCIVFHLLMLQLVII